MIAKITNWVKQYNRDIFLGGCMLLVAVLGYNVGQIRALSKSPVSFSQNAVVYQTEPSAEKITAKAAKVQTVPKDPRVVVSKNSKSKVYHHTWCSGAKRIKEENKIWFDTSTAAEAADYSLAGNCN